MSSPTHERCEVLFHRPFIIVMPQGWQIALTPLTNEEYFARHPKAVCRITSSPDGVTFYSRNGIRRFFSLECLRENAWWLSRKLPHKKSPLRRLTDGMWE